MRKIMLSFLLLLTTKVLTAEDAFSSDRLKEVDFQAYSAHPYLKDVQQYFTEVAIGILYNTLKSAPLNAEERKTIESHIAVIKKLERDKELPTTIFLDMLSSLPEDLSARAKSLNLQLMIHDRNREFVDQLHGLAHHSLLKIIALKDTETPQDIHMAARITLIMTLEGFREMFEFNDQKNEQWNALLSSFQEECRSPSSSLINDLLQKMGPSFFQQPFTALLWKDDISDAVFDSLNQIRKDQFKQVGFVLES